MAVNSESKRRLTRFSFLTLAVILSILGVIATLFSSGADAQVDTCTASDETELAACIDGYNLGSADVYIQLVNDIGLTGALPEIDNGATPSAKLTIDGQGHTLDGNDNTTDVLALADDETDILDITVTGALHTGIRLDHGVLAVSDSTITQNGSVGINTSGPADLVVRDTTVADNALVGIYAGDNSSATVEDSIVTESDTGVYAGHDATVVVRNTTVADNFSEGVFGSGGSLTIETSTLTSNRGGIYVPGSVTVVRNTTIAENDYGISVVLGASVTVENSTIALHPVSGISGPVEILGSIVTSPTNNACSTSIVDLGGNVFGDASCNGVATSGILASTPVLADNGCTAPCTQTIALPGASPAIDAHDGATCHAGLTDQRGVERTAGKCDAGAFELGDCVDGTTVTASDEAELALAIVCYERSTLGITVELTEDISLSQDLPAITHAAASPPLLVIDGQGHTIDGNGAASRLLVHDSGSTTVANITLTGASTYAAQTTGGDFRILDSTIRDNYHGVSASSQLVLMNVTVVRSFGDGVRQNVGGSVLVQSSTIAYNERYGIAGETPEVVGSLIAANDRDCEMETVSDSGGNVFSDDSCTGSGTPAVTDTLGEVLANNGCTTPCTQTLLLLPGSPAIDAHTGSSCSAGALDQRGVARTPGLCDAGAVEIGDCLSSLTVGNTLALAFAIHCYNQGTVDKTIALTNDIELTRELPPIDHTATTPPKLTIDGQGYMLDGTRSIPDLLRQDAGDTTLVDLTLVRSADNSVNVSGGAFSVTDTTITDGATGVNTTSPTPLVITNSTITGNGEYGVRGVPGSEISLVRTTIVDNLRSGVINADVSATGSMIAANKTEGPTTLDCTGTTSFDDRGGNVFGDGTCTGSATPGLLGTFSAALAENGCVSPCAETIALLAGSPAIDAHDGATCTAGLLDQRGLERTAARCDAGAFEAGDRDIDLDGAEGPLGDASDCDDTNPAAYPGATEIAYNGVDEDCNGTDLTDADGDGSTANSATGGSPDCDDTNPAINPDATDIAGNGLDEDCDGSDLAATTEECYGRVVTIDMNTNGGDGMGTAGDDVILGTDDDDVINGLGGDDYICSGAGNDTVDTGDGDDLVRAGSGDDLVYGGNGDDRLFGVTGDDTLHGGDGEDTLHGDMGNDTLYGDNDNDRVYGYADDDIIYGGNGDDKLHGNYGEDQMWGEDGDDIVIGYGDNDILYGGIGNDTLHGNYGDDQMWGEDGDDTLWGYGDDDTIHGGDGDDIMNGNPGNDTLNGDAGNDQIQGADGNDVVNGGDGNDTLDGNSLNDTISGGAGDDTIDGGIDTDTCDGGVGTDTTTRCETSTGIP